MSYDSADADEAIKQISAVLAQLDVSDKSQGLISEWVLIYETTDIVEGNVGGSWGALVNARPVTGLGMAELFADSVKDDQRGWND